MQVLIYVVPMEMQMSHKHDTGANEYFQINLAPVDQSMSSMEKEDSDSFNKNEKNSDFKSNNKIPEYAREYKREYQFIIGINK